MEGTAEVPHPSADAHLPAAASVFDAAPVLDTVRDLVDPQPTLVALLVRHVRLPREFLPQIGINSIGLFVNRYEFRRAIEQEIHNSETPSNNCTRASVDV
jgi:hypothetical protein